MDKFKYPFLVVSVALWAVYVSFSATIVSHRSVKKKKFEKKKNQVVSLIRASGLLSLIYVSIMTTYFTSVGVVLLKRLLVFKSKLLKRTLFLVIFQSFASVMLMVVASCLVFIYFSGFFFFYFFRLFFFTIVSRQIPLVLPLF